MQRDPEPGGFDAASPVKSDPRVPPAALAFEAAIIGACLFDADACAIARLHMEPNDCYDQRHKVALQAAFAVADRGTFADAVAAHEWIVERGQGDLVTLGYLTQLALAPGSTSAIEHYARKVRRCRGMRDALDAAARLLAEGFDPRCDPDAFDALWGNVERHMRAFAQRSVGGTETMLQERLAALYERFTAGVVLPRAISTGLADLDRLLGGGIRPGQLVTVAGRPGHGKTSLALGMVRAACIAGHNVAFVSLEMTGDELLARVASALVRFDVTREAPTVSATLAIQTVAATLSDWRWRTFDTPNSDYQRIERWATGLHASDPIDLLVVDNLQDIALSPYARVRHEELDATVRKLKQLAKTLRCPVLMLAQATREIDERGAAGYYRQADVADTKAIEGASDVLLFTWQPPTGDTTLPQGYAELQIVKNRAGYGGVIRADYDAPTQLFRNTFEPAINRRTQSGSNGRVPTPANGNRR